MKTSELRKLIREEVRKALNEGAGFNSNNPKHQKAAIALSACIKTKIAPLMDTSDCASLLYNIAKDLGNAGGNYDDGLEYYSSVEESLNESFVQETITKADFGRKNNPFTPAAAKGILHLLTDFKLVEKMKNLEKLIDTKQYTAIKKLYDALCSEIEKYKK